MAAMRRFFLKVKTTIQEKSVTPVRKPISDRMVTYSLYESLNFVVPNRIVNTIRICDEQELFLNNFGFCAITFIQGSKIRGKGPLNIHIW